MSLHDDRHVVACQECQTLIFGENVYRHFQMAHHRELSGDELVRILAYSRKNSVSESVADAFVEREYAQEENNPEIERTPDSMRQWDTQGPREGMRSGPLGPGKR